MGSDDVAKLGRGPVSTVRRRGPERARMYPCVLMKVMKVSNESNENMKTEYTRLGRGPVRTVRRRDPERLAVVGQDAIAR